MEKVRRKKRGEDVVWAEILGARQGEVGEADSGKEENGPEKYVGSWKGHVAVRLRFRLRSGSAGLFEDKKRCGMVEEDRCVLCNGGWQMLQVHNERDGDMVAEA